MQDAAAMPRASLLNCAGPCTVIDWQGIAGRTALQSWMLRPLLANAVYVCGQATLTARMFIVFFSGVCLCVFDRSKQLHAFQG